MCFDPICILESPKIGNEIQPRKAKGKGQVRRPEERDEAIWVEGRLQNKATGGSLHLILQVKNLVGLSNLLRTTR